LICKHTVFLKQYDPHRLRMMNCSAHSFPNLSKIEHDASMIGVSFNRSSSLNAPFALQSRQRCGEERSRQRMLSTTCNGLLGFSAIATNYCLKLRTRLQYLLLHVPYFILFNAGVQRASACPSSSP